MADRPTPPEDITPDDFYLKWIPEQAAANPDQSAKIKDIDTVIQVVLTGEGGGDDYMELAGGKIRALREAFWQDVCLVGDGESLNRELERAAAPLLHPDPLHGDRLPG